MICSGYNASTKTIPWESRYKELIVFEKVDDGEEGEPQIIEGEIAEEVV